MNRFFIRKLLFLGFVLLQLICYGSNDSFLSQLDKGLYDGYVVTKEHDTIYGQIAVPRKYQKMYEQIDFIDVNGIEQSFIPTDLIFFRLGDQYFLGNTRVYVNEHPFYKYVFLEQLVDGYLKLYRYENKQLVVTSSSSARLPQVNSKVINYYVVKYGGLKPNTINSIESLAIFTNDNDKIGHIFRNKKPKGEEIIDLLKEYNSWLQTSDTYSTKRKIDSINSCTEINLLQAQMDSLLVYQNIDNNMYEYMFRLIYYAYNSVGFMDYVITDKWNKHNNRLEIGLQISTLTSYNKIGTWQYFYSSKEAGNDKIKKQESFDIKGLLHGLTIKYDKEGIIKKQTRYIHGKRVEI